jgi:hypothetical protein
MLERVGRFVSQAPERGFHRIVMLVAVFLLFAVADFVVACVVVASRLPLPVHGALDGLILGGLAASTAWFFLEAARTDRIPRRAELEQEAHLNHEIRNALEVIAQAGYLISDLNLKKVVSESVNRIDSILKERIPPEERTPPET